MNVMHKTSSLTNILQLKNQIHLIQQHLTNNNDKTPQIFSLFNIIQQ